MFSKGIPDGEEYIGRVLELERKLELDLELELKLELELDDKISWLEDDIGWLELELELDDKASWLEDDIGLLELEIGGISFFKLEELCSSQ